MFLHILDILLQDNSHSFKFFLPDLKEVLCVWRWLWLKSLD